MISCREKSLLHVQPSPPAPDPAAPQGVRLAPHVQLRPRTAQDQPFLLALFCEIRVPEFALAGLPAPALAALLRFQFEAQGTSYRLRHPGAHDDLIWVATPDRKHAPAGRLLVDRTGPAIEIVYIAVAGPFRGAGIATGLLSVLLAEASQRGCPVRLQVRAGNPAAHLYTRLGFAVTGDDGLDLSMECKPSS